MQKLAREKIYCSDKRAFGKMNFFGHREDDEETFLHQEGNHGKSAYGETSIFFDTAKILGKVCRSARIPFRSKRLSGKRWYIIEKNRKGGAYENPDGGRRYDNPRGRE